MAIRDLPPLSAIPQLVREWMRAVQDAIRFVPLYGAGAPSIDAPVGSTYINTNGGAGTTFYVKEAAGTTGWVAK